MGDPVEEDAQHKSLPTIRYTPLECSLAHQQLILNSSTLSDFPWLSGNCGHSVLFQFAGNWIIFLSPRIMIRTLHWKSCNNLSCLLSSAMQHRCKSSKALLPLTPSLSPSPAQLHWVPDSFSQSMNPVMALLSLKTWNTFHRPTQWCPNSFTGGLRSL